MKILKQIGMIMISAFVLSCSQQEQTNQVGSLSIKVQWPDTLQSSGAQKASVRHQIAQAPKGVVTMRVIISGDGMSTMQVDFDATLNQGTVSSVPAGTNRTVTLQGRSGISTVLYQGQTSGVQVLANTVNNAGVIVMAVAAANADGDSVPDEVDDFPNDPSETTDTDDDGTGNNIDSDDDGDGISDADENTLGTNSLLEDTDSDGMYDGQEQGFGFDPLVINAGLPPILRINVTNTGLQTGYTDNNNDEESLNPDISADGRYVVFESTASNLVTGDTNARQDIFLKDIRLGTVARINVSSSGTQADNSGSSPAISAEGRYVVFSSSATNLVASDINSITDIFLKDTQTGSTSRISVDSNEAEATGGASDYPKISSDGHYVVFQSSATNLVSGDTNGLTDIFIRNTQDGTTTRINVNTSGLAATGGSSSTPSFSSDGRYVVFASSATNLVASDTNNSADIFLRDTVAGTTTRVSVDSNEVAATSGDSSSPIISADGRYVVFTSVATNLVPGDFNGVADVFLRDIHAGTTTRVSVDSNGIEGNGISDYSTISADGRYVMFESSASNFVAGDSNIEDIFLKDTHTDITVRISQDSNGVVNSYSENVAMSYDGQYVVFQSRASNLVTGDTNNRRDIFRIENTSFSPDSDQDGLRDDMEILQLTNPTNVDSDNDGLSDYEELNFDYQPWNYATGIDTNPNVTDTDGDGFSDGQERGLGMNPFVHDTGLPSVLRMSIATTGIESNNLSSAPVISSDGRYVAYQSNASNLVLADTNNVSDIFIKDTQTGVTERISVNLIEAEGNGASSDPDISADGRYIVFTSGANNLASNDTNSATDVFLKDRLTGASTRISVDSNGSQPLGGGSSFEPALSADGRYVAFSSDAHIVLDTSEYTDVFLKDTQTNQAYWVSIVISSGTRRHPSISADGNTVLYTHENSDGNYGVRSTTAGTIIPPSSQAVKYTSVSSNGNYIVFNSTSPLLVGETNNVADIYLRDVLNAATIRVSVSSDEIEANGASDMPNISDDGRFIVFESTATNLVAVDTNGFRDIFLRDTLNGTTSIVSVDINGGQINGNSYNPVISADGCFVTFESDASNLTANDSNGMKDIFRVGVCP